MPVELSDLIATEWTEVYQSPFGNSLYSLPGKTWDNTPLGCLRVADHWNFTNKKRPVPAGQTTHCPSDRPVGDGWALGRWDGEKFVILKEYPRVNKRKVRVIKLGEPTGQQQPQLAQAA